MTEYKPGQIAVIRDRFSNPVAWRAVRDEKGWSSLAPEVGWVADEDVIEARPLIVLNQRDANDCVTALRKALGVEESVSACVNIGSVIRKIEEQTRPAIEEPTGLGAVVEDDKRQQWVRLIDDDLHKPWTHPEISIRKNWKIVNAVRVLSEGVQP